MYTKYEICVILSAAQGCLEPPQLEDAQLVTQMVNQVWPQSLLYRCPPGRQNAYIVMTCLSSRWTGGGSCVPRGMILNMILALHITFLVKGPRGSVVIKRFH